MASLLLFGVLACDVATQNLVVVYSPKVLKQRMKNEEVKDTHDIGMVSIVVEVRKNRDRLTNLFASVTTILAKTATKLKSKSCWIAARFCMFTIKTEIILITETRTW